MSRHFEASGEIRAGLPMKAVAALGLIPLQMLGFCYWGSQLLNVALRYHQSRTTIS
jgi:hypothetical protein